MLYKSCRNCLSNNVQSISCHIILLVNNSLGDRHTCTHAQTDFWAKAVLRNQECTGQHAPSLKQKALIYEL